VHGHEKIHTGDVVVTFSESAIGILEDFVSNRHQHLSEKTAVLLYDMIHALSVILEQNNEAIVSDVTRTRLLDFMARNVREVLNFSIAERRRWALEAKNLLTEVKEEAARFSHGVHDGKDDRVHAFLENFREDIATERILAIIKNYQDAGIDSSAQWRDSGEENDSPRTILCEKLHIVARNLEKMLSVANERMTAVEGLPLFDRVKEWLPQRLQAYVGYDAVGPSEQERHSIVRQLDVFAEGLAQLSVLYDVGDKYYDKIQNWRSNIWRVRQTMSRVPKREWYDDAERAIRGVRYLLKSIR